MAYLFKHIFLPLLCSAMFCGILTGTAAAAETEEIPDTEISVSEQTAEFIRYELPSVSAVNPLYEEILTEEDILTAPALDADSPSEPDFTKYLSYEEACDDMRQNLICRQETITAYIHMVSPTSSEITNIVKNFFYSALEHTGEPKEGDSLRWHWATYSCTSPVLYRSGNNYYFELPYVLNYYTTAEQEAAVDLAVEALMEEIFTEDASDFEIVKAAYDWICENVRYDYANLNDSTYKLKYSTYAALIDNTAVCQGYALLMYRLMLEQGIDCRLIPGDGGGAHAWNIVELDNVYYNLDATWDEGNAPETYQWFLLSEESFVDHTRYNNDRYGYYDTEEFHAAYPMAKDNYFSDEDIRAGGTLDEESGVRWDITYGGTLIISGEGAMPDFTQSDENGITIRTENLPWNALRSKIQKIVVEPGITSLGDGAFYASANAVSVEIADTVTEMGLWAFANCTSLTDIEIPGNVAYIDYAAFGNCASLTEIRFAGNAPQIDSLAFSGTAAEAYYPADNSTWTTEVLQDYGGTLTWIPLSSRTGDADGDGSITVSDAVYLLRHTILPDCYLPAENADYNNDGSVDIYDVICLLNHIANPGSHPLH